MSIQQDLKNNEIRISSDCGRWTRAVLVSTAQQHLDADLNHRCSRPLYIVDYERQKVLINRTHAARQKAIYTTHACWGLSRFWLMLGSSAEGVQLKLRSTRSKVGSGSGGLSCAGALAIPSLCSEANG